MQPFYDALRRRSIDSLVKIYWQTSIDIKEVFLYHKLSFQDLDFLYNSFEIIRLLKIGPVRIAFREACAKDDIDRVKFLYHRYDLESELKQQLFNRVCQRDCIEVYKFFVNSRYLFKSALFLNLYTRKPSELRIAKYILKHSSTKPKLVLTKKGLDQLHRWGNENSIKFYQDTF